MYTSLVAIQGPVGGGPNDELPSKVLSLMFPEIALRLLRWVICVTAANDWVSSVVANSHPQFCPKQNSLSIQRIWVESTGLWVYVATRLRVPVTSCEAATVPPPRPMTRQCEMGIPTGRVKLTGAENTPAVGALIISDQTIGPMGSDLVPAVGHDSDGL